jgi:hypothetical protein
VIHNRVHHKVQCTEGTEYEEEEEEEEDDEEKE